MEKQKTNKIFFCCGFAECNDHCTRQSWENSSNNFPDLPSAMAIALGKENFKKNKKCFAECLGGGTRQRKLKKIKTGFAECLGAMALGKEF